MYIFNLGQYTLQVEARDGFGSGPFTDNAEIIIVVQSINNHRPTFIMPALSNASVELPEVNKLLINYNLNRLEIIFIVDRIW